MITKIETIEGGQKDVSKLDGTTKQAMISFQGMAEF